MAQEVLVGITLAVIVVIPVAAMWRVLRARQGFGTTNERATYDVLHLANQAAPLFRRGLNSVGLANVDERLRTVYGPEYGLVMETGPQSGTKVLVRVPKFRAGVRATPVGYRTGTEVEGEH